MTIQIIALPDDPTDACDFWDCTRQPASLIREDMSGQEARVCFLEEEEAISQIRAGRWAWNWSPSHV